MISDVRVELEHDAAGTTADAASIVYRASAAARGTGDLARVAAAPPAEGGVRPCATWAPGPDDGVAALAAVPDGWRGLVRCVPAALGGAATLRPWAIGDLAAVLGDLRRPLLVDLRDAEPPPYEALHELAVAFPTLPVLVGLGGPASPAELRLLGALGDACPNLFLETSGLAGAQELHAAIAALGADRLLYGSGGSGTALTPELVRAAVPNADVAAAILHDTCDALAAGRWAPTTP